MNTNHGRDLPADLYFLRLILIPDKLDSGLVSTQLSLLNVWQLRNYSKIIVLWMFGKSTY